MTKFDFFNINHEDRIRLIAGDDCEFLDSSSTAIAAVGGVDRERFIALATDPSVDRGALGVREVADIRRALALAQSEKIPLVLIIDSAGARVSEGVAIQGALRMLFTHLIDARFAGTDMIAILGRNVFGGASMLAMACRHRLYFERTRLAMTGPAVIKAHNSVPIEAVNRTLSAENRLQQDGGGVLIERKNEASREAIVDTFRQCLYAVHEPFESHLAAQETALLSRIRADDGADKADTVDFQTERIVLKNALAAGPRAIMRAAAAVKEVSSDTASVTVHCEWAGHSTNLADEDKLLSQYLIYLCCLLRQKELRGTRIHLNVAGELSGGLYICLAGGSSKVMLAPGGNVLTLPQRVLDAFINIPAEPQADAKTLMFYQVADAVNV